MRPTVLLLWSGLLVPWGPALGQGAKPRSDMTTVVYDVTDLVRRPGLWGSLGEPRARDAEPIDLLMQQIVFVVEPGSWKGVAENGGTIRAWQGTQLEVRASPKAHEQIRQLLEALRRLFDAAIDVEAVLHQVDRAWFDKEVQPKLGKQAVLPVDEALVESLRRHSSTGPTHQVRIVASSDVVVFAVHDPLIYPGKPAARPVDAVVVDWTGVSIRAQGWTSADRRRLGLKLTQSVKELARLDTKEVVDPITDKNVPIKSPRFRLTSQTDELTLDDGQIVLVPVRYVAAAAANRVPVLVVKPVIVVKAEERPR
ncbi:MAG: hypothetical protein NZ700_14190 [Gemmataceae bacterium]|nr:hypothetical protein [Gemmataceae bacterium]MDW8264574.1 hypothetical protein [Gemmataceae bacterium]